MKRRNKVTRQESWIEEKKQKSKDRLRMRHDRRKEEERNPELRAERLAKNKPITQEDKRVFPTSEDDWARRKRRKVVPAVEKEEEKEEKEDEEDEEGKEEDRGKKEEKGQEEDEDSDDSFFNGEDDDDDDDDEDDEEMEGMNAAERRAAKQAKQKEKEKAEHAAAREAHESAMAAKYATLLEGEAPAEPKILITTSRHATIHRYAETLTDLFPNSTYIPRSGHKYIKHEYSIREIAKYATNRGFTALLVLNEDLKKPSGLDVLLLPQGPMLHFTITTWVDGQRLPNHARSTNHVPEVLCTNFVTPLGKLVGNVLQRLFPQTPEVIGRQVLTLHNQRDYVFVRRHRYMFRERRPTERSITDKEGKVMAGVEDVRVALQEIGPRMTLKLRRVDRGIQHMSGQAFTWKTRMEKTRTMWQL